MERKYEAIFVFKINDNFKNLIKQVNKIFENYNMKIIRKDDLGEKKLAYTIKGYNQGHYYYLDLVDENNRDDVEGKISMELNTIEDLIKHIIIKKD